MSVKWVDGGCKSGGILVDFKSCRRDSIVVTRDDSDYNVYPPSCIRYVAVVLLVGRRRLRAMLEMGLHRSLLARLFSAAQAS